MARIRYIKPSFFTSDEVADLPPLVRILFAGLWCLADRDGRIEDRPKRIKAEVMPHDRLDVPKAIDLLAERGFLHRYDGAGLALIHVTNFHIHQHPHHKEPASALAPCPIHESMHEPSTAYTPPVDESTTRTLTSTRTLTRTGTGNGANPERLSARQLYERAAKKPIGQNKQLRDELDRIEAEHGRECMEWAFAEAALAGAEKEWPYARKILASCATDGHGPHRGEAAAGDALEDEMSAQMKRGR